MPAAGLSEHRDGFLNAGERIGGALLLLPDFRHEMERDARLNAPAIHAAEGKTLFAGRQRLREFALPEIDIGDAMRQTRYADGFPEI